MNTRTFLSLIASCCFLDEATLAQTPLVTINSFDSGIPGSTPTSGGVWMGSASLVFDPNKDNTTNGGGSAYVSSVFSSMSDTPLAVYVTIPPFDSMWWNGGTGVPLSQYNFIEFDIWWDITSSLTIDQFNTYSDSTSGIQIGLAGLSTPPTIIMTTNIPLGASNGWVHMSIPIDSLQPGIDGAGGICFLKQLTNSISGPSSDTALFWIDNIVFKATEVIPVPILKPPRKPSLFGLHIFANTDSYLDRHQIALVESNGLSWVGRATQLEPVVYSFTVTNFPQDVDTYDAFEGYVFLSPHPGSFYSAADYYATNCIVLSLSQHGNGTSSLSFNYKVNEAAGNQMYTGQGSYTNLPGSWDGSAPDYLEQGYLGAVTYTGTALGSWSARFTSDTNCTLVAPDGTTTNIIIPTYNAGYFGETDSSRFFVCLGQRAHNAASRDKEIVFSSFSISGIPVPLWDNFVTDTTLDTSIWMTDISQGSQDIYVTPQSPLYILEWYPYVSGFGLESSPDMVNWTSQNSDVVVICSSFVLHILTTNNIPMTGSQFFRLKK
jgi:hypothetical protein